MSTHIIAEVDFNRPKDRTGSNMRVLSLYAGKRNLYLSFELGKEPDDSLNLVVPIEEFLAKIGRAIAAQTVDDENS